MREQADGAEMSVIDVVEIRRNGGVLGHPSRRCRAVMQLQRIDCGLSAFWWVTYSGRFAVLDGGLGRYGAVDRADDDQFRAFAIGRGRKPTGPRHGQLGRTGLVFSRLAGLRLTGGGTCSSGGGAVELADLSQDQVGHGDVFQPHDDGPAKYLVDLVCGVGLVELGEGGGQAVGGGLHTGRLHSGSYPVGVRMLKLRRTKASLDDPRFRRERRVLTEQLWDRLPPQGDSYAERVRLQGEVTWPESRVAHNPEPTPKRPF